MICVVLGQFWLCFRHYSDRSKDNVPSGFASGIVLRSVCTVTGRAAGIYTHAGISLYEMAIKTDIHFLALVGNQIVGPSDHFPSIFKTQLVCTSLVCCLCVCVIFVDIETF